jgi:sulfate adenylyltransferase
MPKQISPHGGKLINCQLAPQEKEYWERKINSLKSITLKQREISDLELIANGAFSPVEGFMTRKDYEPVVHEMRLSSGLVWSLPITLAVNETQASDFSPGEEIALNSYGYSAFGGKVPL